MAADVESGQQHPGPQEPQQLVQLHGLRHAPSAPYSGATLSQAPQEERRAEEQCTKPDQQQCPRVGRPPPPSASTQLHPAPPPHAAHADTDPHPTSGKDAVATTLPSPGGPTRPAPAWYWPWPWRPSRCCSPACCSPSRSPSWPALSAFVLLTWSSLGVIFGDIATSPLYVFTTVFAELGTQQPSKVRGGRVPQVLLRAWRHNVSYAYVLST